MSENLNTQSIDELASRICRLYRVARGAMANALAAALDTGDVLIEAQDRVPNGQWGKWLHENCLMGLSTAKLYMQLARNREKIEAEIERVGDLSLRAARRFVAGSQRAAGAAGSFKAKPDPAESDVFMEKVTLILRKALSLVKSANTAGISPAAAEGNKNEALASIQQLVVLLMRHGIDLNDVVLNAIKKTKADRRAA